MAGNSMDSLLEWMKNPQNNVMWGWDAIAAMARSKTNTLLVQEYIARFTTGSYLPPVSGVVPIIAGENEERLKDFILDAPRLSFLRLDPDDPNSQSEAWLTCAILGGMQVTMENEDNVWRAVKIVETDPLQGPRLILELNLAKVPGNVTADGRVLFDLQYSDKFSLTFDGTAAQQALGGDFFEHLFKALPADKRIWELGRIADGGEESLRPQSFKLAVQANRLASRNVRDASYGDGALLICMCMAGSQEGGGLPPEYKYLIPDDVGEDYSATVLFEQKRMTKAIGVVDHALAHVAELIGSGNVTAEYDEHGQFVRAESNGGGLLIPPGIIPMVPLFYEGEWIRVFMQRGEAFIPADSSHPLIIYPEGDGVICVEWCSECIDEIVLVVDDKPDSDSIDILYTIKLKARFSILEENNDLIIAPVLELTVDKEVVSSLLEEGDEGAWALVLLLYLMGALMSAAFTTIEPIIRVFFDRKLSVSAPASSFIQDSVKLNFGNAIQGDSFRAPRDIGVFGHINPTRTSFAIIPLEPLVAAGESQSFSIEPAVDGVTWQVEALEANGTSPLGSIHPTSGLYTAPPASAITGRFHRERVVARDPSSDYSSSALVTVLVNQVTINPLIQVCPFTRTVELAAGALGGEDLQWSVVNANPAEAGSVAPSIKPGGDHTYTPGAQVANKTYVLDEVVVSNGQVSRSAWVLVIQNAPGLIVKPSSTAGLPAGQLPLKAIVNNNDVTAQCTWSLPMNGPGSINESTGLYTVDPATTERFVLIVGVVDGGLLGKFEGHIILPLPLGEFESELDRMKV